MKQAETGPVETGIRNCYNITIKEMLRNISGIVSAASGCGAALPDETSLYPERHPEGGWHPLTERSYRRRIQVTPSVLSARTAWSF